MKKTLNHMLVMVLCLCNTMIYAQSNETNKNDYDYIQIGKQKWMSKNLEATSFRNGDAIKYAKSKTQWDSLYKARLAAWCYADFDTSKSKYGIFYNGYAAQSSLYLAPEGWHIASDAEWDTLVSFLGGGNNNLAATKLIDSTKFNALAGGFYSGQPTWTLLNEYAKWWTSTVGPMGINIKYYSLDFKKKLFGNFNHENYYGLNIRCIKDQEK